MTSDIPWIIRKISNTEKRLKFLTIKLQELKKDLETRKQENKVYYKKYNKKKEQNENK